MKIAIRVIPLLFALMFLLTSLQWIVDPAGAARGLEMELQSGLGASTQIGDLGAFFFASSLLIGFGSLTGRSHWLYAPALLIGSAALIRSLAWASGNAAFGTKFIVAELVMTALLVAAARLRADEPAPNAG